MSRRRRRRVRALALAGLAWLATGLASPSVRAQAEPAPEDYVPPKERNLPPEERTPKEPEPLARELPKWHLAVAPRLVLSLGVPDGLPAAGLGGGIGIARALLQLGQWLRLGAGFDFAFDRLSSDINRPSQADRSLSHASFALVAVLDALVGPGRRLRPYVAAGGGLSVGSYFARATPTTPTVDLVEALGLIHVAAGLGVRVYEGFEVGLHGELNATFSSTRTGSPPQPVFQPGLFELALDLGFRF